jgi:hypothetical protein
MSKLSHTVKALINAPHAEAGYRSAPANVKELLLSIANDAVQRQVDGRAWIAISVSPPSHNQINTC